MYILSGREPSCATSLPVARVLSVVATKSNTHSLIYLPTFWESI